jgi:hypothetical protein
MLGWVPEASASSSWDAPDAEVSAPEQLATKRRKTVRHAKTTKGALLLGLKALSPLLIVM